MKKRIVSRYRGFTLIELVVVIVVVGILSALGGLIITNHMQGYVDMSNRAQLVDSAESALRRMERDIQAALPNSIVVGTDGDKVTFLHTAAGGRYRTKCPALASDCSHNQTLQFNQTDSKFSMIGRLRENSEVLSSGGANDKVVIYNTGQPPADAYNSTYNNTADILDVGYDGDVGVAPSSNFTISEKRFPYRSPYKRFQIVDTQVCYSLKDDKLWRYHNSTSITDPDKANGCKDWGSGSLIARHVEEVNFEYDSGAATRSALLTMNATLSKEGETITLLHQVHVLNYP